MKGAVASPPLLAVSPGPVLIGAAELARRVEGLAAEIARVFAGETLDFVVVLEGARQFGRDLVSALGSDARVRTHFVQAASYGCDTESSGRVHVNGDCALDLTGSRVVIVDDIVDTGRTANALTDRLEHLRPGSVSLASLLDKPSRRAVDVSIDFCGFQIPDEFVVGYGMDYGGAFRDLPDIRVLRRTT